MRIFLKAGLLAASMVVAGVSCAAAAPAHKPIKQSAYAGHHGRLVYATVTQGGYPGQRGYRPLVGDRRSGLGFYPLPAPIRMSADRYRARTERPPWANPIRQAVAADGARYGYGYWTPTAATSYRYGVFDPNDGVGTPFFGGYYNAGTHDRDDDDDDDDPTPLFARPLR